MNTYQVTIRFRENGRHRRLELLASDSDQLYRKIDFVMSRQPAHDIVSVKLEGQELLVNEDGTPRTDQQRMNESAARDNARKWATSVMRDWDRPDSWSTGTLRASAHELVEHADLRDLSILQRAKLRAIGDGSLPRPEHEEI